jgi:hypothetical protein
MSPASTAWSWGSPAWVIQVRPVTTSTGSAVGLAHKVWAGIWHMTLRCHGGLDMVDIL